MDVGQAGDGGGGRAARVLGAAAALVAAAIAAAVLVGWAISSDRLRSVVPGMVAMNPLTAGCLIGCAAALLLWRPAAAGPRRWLPLGLGGAVAVCGAVRLGGVVGVVDLHIDQQLFADQLAAAGANRMAPNTALNFLLLGAALVLVAAGRARTAQGLALAAASTAFVACVGYAYSMASLTRVSGFIPMALHTAVSFLLVCGALLCATQGHGVVASVTRDTPGGRVVRRFLPALVLGPVLFGWLRLQGELAGLYGASFGLALTIGAMVVLGIVLTFTTASALDATYAEHRRLLDLTRRMAHFDALTGLPNRALLEGRLGGALARAARASSNVALLFVDLDGFKHVNDTMGHAAGDEVLQEAARRLNATVRAGDTVARLGGDEFVIVLEQLARPSEVQTVGSRILAALEQPYLLAGGTAALSGSIGASVFPADASTPERLVALADAAMYQAKRAGKGRVVAHRAGSTPPAPAGAAASAPLALC